MAHIPSLFLHLTLINSVAHQKWWFSTIDAGGFGPEEAFSRQHSAFSQLRSFIANERAGAKSVSYRRGRRAEPQPESLPQSPLRNTEEKQHQDHRVRREQQRTQRMLNADVTYFAPKYAAMRLVYMSCGLRAWLLTEKIEPLPNCL